MWRRVCKRWKQLVSSFKNGIKRSPADDEIGFASHLGRKPKVEDDVLASTAASLKDKTTIARTSKIQKGSPLLETSNDGFIPESFVSKGEDENENIEQGLQEESEVNVKAVRQSAVNQEEATSVTSTTEGTPVVNPGRRRAHNSRASSRRRERNVRLPVITENVEVKPNVRLSLKLYESLRLDNLNITEDCPQDEVARESNNLTVDDILAEVMTYCRENDVPTKENHLNDFQDKNGEQQRKQPDLELIPTSQPDDKLTTNSELCLTYSETSSTKPVVSSHNTRIVNWKLQKHQQISQPSSQFALTSDSDETSSLTTIGFSDDYLSTAHTMENKSHDDGCIHEAELDEVPDTYLSHGQALEDKPCSVGGGHESELEGCGQVEEQDDEGSVLLEDGCNSSCSSGSDSGRGESETSCPTPEEPLSCNSGGSDDGMWTAEDYSCLNHMTTSTDCHLQPETYQTDRSCYGKIQTNPRQASENSSTNTAEKFNFFTRNMDAKENVSSYYECGQAASSVLNNEKRSAIEPKAFLEESHYKKKQENSRKPGPMKFYVHEDYPTISVPNRSEALATLFEDYDNVDNCHNTDSSGVELGPELEIIDLNDETTSDQPMNNRDDTKKSKGFFGRRCTSFNTLRSFISNTTSHLKRNGQRRSSFSSSKSLPNYFSGTTAAPDLTSYSGTTQLKSIFKNNANKNDSNLKRNSSKRISFSDTIDVYPSSAKSFQVNAESKRSYRYPAGLEIPEYSPKRNLDLSRAAGKGADPLELSRDLDFGVSVQVQNAKDRTEICHSNEFDQNSRNESVPLPARDSFDFSDILSSLNDFKDEAQMTNSNRANSVAKNVVNLQQINETDTKRTRSQELDTMNQTSLYSFRQPPAGGTNYTFSQEKNEVSYLYPEHYSEHAAADHGGELTSATPAALTGPEKPSGAGSGQALLEALELELEDVLRSLEDEETELQ